MLRHETTRNPKHNGNRYTECRRDRRDRPSLDKLGACGIAAPHSRVCIPPAPPPCLCRIREKENPNPPRGNPIPNGDAAGLTKDRASWISPVLLHAAFFCSSRLRVVATAFASISRPMNFLPKSTATTPVGPPPQNGSSTVSPALVNRMTMSAIPLSDCP